MEPNDNLPLPTYLEFLLPRTPNVLAHHYFSFTTTTTWSTSTWSNSTRGPCRSPMQAHLYAGFLGGMASAVALQPMDLLKTRLQQAPHTLTFAETVRSLGSLRAAWRGTLPSVLRTSVGAGLYLSTLNRLRALRAEQTAPRGPPTATTATTATTTATTATTTTTQATTQPTTTTTTTQRSSVLPRLRPSDNALIGGTARAAVGFIMMPLTVVKVRIESDLFAYTDMRSAFRDVVATGGVRGLFAGFGATLSRDAPYAGLYVLCYEQLKDALQTDRLPGAAVNAAAAMGAATLSTTVTAPFDTLKTRIQVSVAPLSLRQAFREVVGESWRALFDGLSLRLARKAFSAGISWCIYEEIVKWTASEH